MSTKMKPNDYMKIEFCSVRSRNGSAFMKELKEYIIRIFASKKIMEIR